MSRSPRTTFPAHYSARTGTALSAAGHVAFAAFALSLLIASPTVVHGTVFTLGAHAEAPALELDNALARR